MKENLIAKIIDDIKRGDANSVDTYLTTIEQAANIEGTQTTFYSHLVAKDGNGKIRLDDFIEFIIRHIIEYVIPKSRILKAKKEDELSGLSTQIVRLNREAEKLFTPLKKTGEGGEMLLFILGEVLLKLPQLFCKMSVKTSGGVHFHGADGIHVGISADEKLELYWGESKFHSTFESAISDCLDSLSPILKRENDADLEDLLLLQNHLDLGDSKYTDVFKHILNKDNSEFNSVKYCGLCLIGFDHDLYDSAATDDLIKSAFAEWKKSMSVRLNNRKLNDFSIHFFCLPLTSVDQFRQIFLKKLGFE